jgi:hypothetical protein
MINHLIHVYRKGTIPFQSLSALSDADATKIMQNLYIEGAIFWERFENPAQYLKTRRQIEYRLREEFIAKGGKPRESYPIYMIYGRSKWLIEAPDAKTLSTTTEIQIPLSLFQKQDLSFTYPDSMVSFLLLNQKDSPYYLSDFHGKVFILDEIQALVQSNGLPGGKWGNNLPRYFANYIEVQVWNQEPLLEYQNRITLND